MPRSPSEVAYALRGNTMEVFPTKAFQHEKSQCLAGVDWSRKGSVDAPIESMVRYINELPSYFTTSSCSGRICLYEQNVDTASEKQGCRWLLTSHDAVQTEQVIEAGKKSEGDSYFKFEAFVMHTQCWRLEDAQSMHAVAVASGFRNSGITVGRKGKIIVAVRSTHGLEAPVTVDGKLIVSEQYVAHLCKVANGKMDENITRINRFFTNLKAMLENRDKTTETQTTKKKQHHKHSTQENKADSTSIQQENESGNTDSLFEECGMLFDET